jgi:hypothetical protein
MNSNLMHFLVFSTNIKSIRKNTKNQRALNNNMEVREWNIDVDNGYCVLRIVTKTLSAKSVIANINGRASNAASWNNQNKKHYQIWKNSL